MDKPTNLAFSFVMVDGKHPGALAAGTPERVQGEVKASLVKCCGGVRLIFFATGTAPPFE